MPTYNYECQNCGHTIEVIQKITEEPLKKCPDCHKNKLQRILHAAGIQLKGGGWYKTSNPRRRR